MAGQYTPEEYQEILDAYNEALIKGMDQNSAAFRQLKENLDDAKIGIKNYAYQMRQASQQLGSSMLNLGKSFASGAQGAAVFNDSLTSGANLASKALEKFGPWGQALGMATKALGAYVGAVNQQSDALFKSYQEISRTGAIGAGGMTEVYQNLKKFGYGIDELGNMGALLANNGKNLALFGGSVGRGTKQIADLAQGVKDSDLQRQFMNLGLSVDAQNHMIAGYAIQQGRLGRSTDLTTKGMAAYVREQEILTRLTGQSAQEMQDQFEAALQMDDFMAGIMDMPEEAQKQAKSVINQLNAIDPSGKMARGFAASVNGLGHTTEEGAQMYAASNGKIQEAALALARGTISASDFMQQYGDAVGQNIDTMKNLSKIGANYMGPLAANVRMAQQASKGFGKIMDETGKSVDNTAVGLDSTTNSAVELRQSQMKARDSMENFLQLGVGPVTSAMSMLAKVVEHLYRLLPGSSYVMDSEKDAKRLAAEKAQLDKDIVIRKQQLDDVAKKQAELEQAKKEGKPAEVISAKEAELKQAKATLASTGVDLAKATAALAEQQNEKVKESKQELEQIKQAKREAEKDARVRLTMAKTLEEKAKAEQESAKIAQDLLEKEKNVKAALATSQAEKSKLTDQAGRDRMGQQRSLAIGKVAASPGIDLVKDTDLLDRLTKGGITDKKAQANILAQIAAESGGVAKSENLNYRPDRLLAKFPGRVKDLDDAKSLVSQGPEAIGNRIYGGRKDLGNAADEGYKYRGRGIIQITGKSNYKQYGDIIGQDLVGNPDLANDPEIAKQIAVAYFKQKQKAKVNLSDISAIGKAVGYVDTGGAETRKRAGLAQMYETQIPQAANGNVLSGPDSGYRAMLHGTEAVVPLPDGRTIPVTIAGLAEQNDRLATVLQSIEQKLSGPGPADSTGNLSQALLSKLDDLIRVASDQLGVSGKILKAQA